MKQRINDGFIYFIYVLAAEFIGFWLADLAYIIIDLFTADSWRVFGYIMSSIGSIITLFLCCQRDGYKSAGEGYRFSFRKTIPFAAGLAVYVLMNVIWSSNPAGVNSLFLTYLFVGSCDLDSVQLLESHRIILLLGVVVNMLIKYPFMVLGYEDGARKRAVDGELLFYDKKHSKILCFLCLIIITLIKILILERK